MDYLRRWTFHEISQVIHFIMKVKKDSNVNGVNWLNYCTLNQTKSIFVLQNSVDNVGWIIWTHQNQKVNGRQEKILFWFVMYMRSRKDGQKYRSYWIIREMSIQ